MEGCEFELTRGKNKGKPCGRGIYSDSEKFCKRHYYKNKKNERTRKRRNVISMDKEEKEISQSFSGGRIKNILEKYKPESVDPDSEVRRVKIKSKENKIDKILNGENLDSSLKQTLDELDPSQAENEEDKQERIRKAADKLNELNSKEEVIKRGLYNMNLLLFNVMESSSITFEEELGGNLEGLTGDVQAQEEIYKEILLEIYLEYSEEIDPFLNPLAIYAGMVGNTVSNRYIRNKKGQSSEN